MTVTDKPKRKEYIVKDKPPECPSCVNYATCTEPCEAVELWASQDTIGRNSKMVLQNKSTYSIGYPNYAGKNGHSLYGHYDEFVDLCKMGNPNTVGRDSASSHIAWEIVSAMRLSDKVTRFIYSYYMLGKRIRDIAIEEGATSQAIDQRHIQAKKSVAKHLDMKRMWPAFRDALTYKDIRSYDMARLFYLNGYPRKIIAKLMGAHVSTVIRSIKRKS